MHIKQITLSNFRSFRQQPEIESFVGTTNCIVGRNGSGKSNLLDAVQFVLLAPRFANLRQVGFENVVDVLCTLSYSFLTLYHPLSINYRCFYFY